MTPEITPADREAAQKFDTALDVRLTGTRLHNLAGAFARHRIAAEQRAREICAEVCEARGNPAAAKQFLSGDLDGGTMMQSTEKALREPGL